MDHKKAKEDDVRYLVQPRGPGKSWVFRMMTPPDLVGVPNPWDGKPFGKEIKKGLGTRRLPEARILRDIELGEVRKLTEGLSEDAAFALPSAIEWREHITSARRSHSDRYAADGIEFVLADKLEAAEARGRPQSQLKRFSRVATGKGFPLEAALNQYVTERQPNNVRGYHPEEISEL